MCPNCVDSVDVEIQGCQSALNTCGIRQRKVKPSKNKAGVQFYSSTKTVTPRSHVPVFDRPGANRPVECTTWDFKTSPVLTGRSNDEERCTKQLCVHIDLQWIVIH
jgi:hypothetical protein